MEDRIIKGSYIDDKILELSIIDLWFEQKDIDETIPISGTCITEVFIGESLFVQIRGSVYHFIFMYIEKNDDCRYAYDIVK